MLKERSFVRGAVVLAVCIMVPLAPASAGTPGPRHPVEFTLAAVAVDPAPIPFTLAPTAIAGPAGAGVIEDPNLRNTAVGWTALSSNTTGSWNTAIGFEALYFNDTGRNNIAIGHHASYWNVSGHDNVAIGGHVLFNNWEGQRNTAVGNSAMLQLSGNDNTAVGYGALLETGSANTGVGAQALFPSSGSKNTALGYNAGMNIGWGPEVFYNLLLGADVTGETGETNTIRIGLPYNTSVQPPAGQNRVFVSGIVETPFLAQDAVSIVGITSEGRLGTMSSDLLPEGPQGPQGIQGPPGPTGEGLVPGSLLYLAAGYAPPAGYALLGTTELPLIDSATKRVIKVKINVYQKL
jgi:hypothetical protein